MWRSMSATAALWSASGIGSAYDVPGIWRDRAPRFTGRALDCGHFLAEERPQETGEILRSFLCT
jgi:haloacetate dehalogenase